MTSLCTSYLVWWQEAGPLVAGPCGSGAGGNQASGGLARPTGGPARPTGDPARLVHGWARLAAGVPQSSELPPPPLLPTPTLG
jgi:hypothetical protein